MTIDPQWLIFGGIAVLAGGLTLLHRAKEKKRRAAYEEFCLVRGFTFEAERPDGARRFTGVLEVLEQGRNRRWGYTVSGTKNQMPFTAFEYRWVTGGGKSSSTHHLAGIMWEDTGASFPKFTLSPEGWFSRLGEMFGMQDIDFADSPDFSKAYRLKGPNEPLIRELFTSEIRRFFEATPRQNVAAGGHFLLWWAEQRLPAAEALDEWLELGDQVRRRFFKR